MIDFKIKSMFFDRKAVMSAVDKATRKVLSKIGAYIRTTARQSIKTAPKVDAATGMRLGRGRRKAGQRTRDAVSAPGSPPYSHNRLLKDNIYFGYEAPAKTVVVGPVLVSAKGRASGTVPQVLESGGTVTVIPKSGRPRNVSIEPRPYMAPALAVNLPKLPAMWANSVTR